jgi:hypothetical protein
MNRSLISVVAAAAIAWFVVWIVTHYEKREVEYKIGFQGEARRNPMLAAGKLLRRMGIDATEIKAVAWASGPPGPGVFVLASHQGSITESRAEVLLDWVEKGGYLIFAPRAPLGDEGDEIADPLLESLGVDISWADDWWDELHDEEDFEWRSVIPIQLDGADLNVQFSNWMRLESSFDYAASANDELGACLLRGAYGAGHVVILCDPLPFFNRYIQDHDHAEFLVRLVGLAGTPAKVWLVYEHEAMPALPVWLWQQAPEALLGLALCMLVAFWSVCRRFGPLQRLGAPVRRQLSEHLQSAGQFLWRYNQGELLLAGARKPIHRFARRRVRGWEQMAASEQAKILSELLGVSESLAYSALNATADGGRRRFLLAVRDLHKIRQRLEKNY